MYFKILKENSWKDKIGFFLFICSLISILIMIFLSFNRSIWADEALTFKIIKQSYFGMIQLTAADVHPPLYYIILKTTLLFFNLFKLPFDEIILGKLVSVVPFVLLSLISFIKLRKEWGFLTIGLFMFTITAMPQLMMWGTDLRMYSWAMFFVTLTFIYAFDVLKKFDKKSWILLTIFALLSAYTHYFAAVAVSIIYLFILFNLIKNNSKQIKICFRSVIIAIMLYMPWFIVVINQILRIKNNYWIKPITLESIISYFYFISSPSSYYSSVYLTTFDLWGSLLLIVIIVLVILILRLDNKSEKDYFAIYGIFILVFTALFGVLISFLVRPVFVDRYLFPTLGCFWFGVAYCLNRISNKKQIFLPLILILIIVSSLNVYNVVDYNKNTNENMGNFEKFINNITDNDIVIYNHVQLYSLGEYYLNNSTNYMNLEYLNVKQFYGDTINSTDDVKNYLAANKTVWVFCLFDDEKNFVNNWSKKGFTLKRYDAYNLEFYNFSIYSVS